jgi:hypothetical protein
LVFSARFISGVNQYIFWENRMGSEVTLEMIFDEVKRVNERLRLIEDVIEEVVIKGLPEVALSKEKIREIEHSIREMKQGNCVTLEELKSA